MKERFDKIIHDNWFFPTNTNYSDALSGTELSTYGIIETSCVPAGHQHQLVDTVDNIISTTQRSNAFVNLGCEHNEVIRAEFIYFPRGFSRNYRSIPEILDKVHEQKPDLVVVVLVVGIHRKTPWHMCLGFNMRRSRIQG
ncbi:glucose-1-phosphate adenylyltransferase [Striga asiatica]|uniref:Glucose-1-phosphate adenylyltransferase n=1 Tax=Striga asiatica TaxID=4170 RepID=A0A5A7NXZ9_STRAF|nr:glucose-1-phosphate adenylyltransferase [Striga asiatica]